MPTIHPSHLVAHARGRLPVMVEALAALVAVESPSDDREALERCAGAVAALAEELVGEAPERVDRGGHPHLRLRLGTPRVLLLGHLDTVWPLGTTDRWPFRVEGDRATGPGAFDMKAGLVQGLVALSSLPDPDGVTLVVTSDEEITSRTSRALIEEEARGLDAVLVLEPSAAGRLKTGRKGVSLYTVEVHGRAAHAGLEPERGVNALVELAEQVGALGGLADPAAGTTVTPTVASAGTTTNTVPARARAAVDVRCATAEEQARVDRGLRALVARHPDARLEIEGGPNRPPYEERMSRDLWRRAVRLGDELGLPPLGSAVVGGGSDGNFTAALGVPTLDGLGPVGAHAHAEGEYVEVPPMADRAALVAALLAELLARDAPAPGAS